jgi:hypothetical protein
MVKFFLFFSEFGCGYLRVWPKFVSRRWSLHRKVSCGVSRFWTGLRDSFDWFDKLTTGKLRTGDKIF